MTKRALIILEGTRMGTGLLYTKSAQSLGLHPITLSANPSKYDYLAAGAFESICVDTDDMEAMVQECSKARARYGLAGITSPLDAFYAKVGKLCQHFKLPGPDPVSIERCCDKFVQRQLLKQAGVPIPAFRSASKITEVEAFGYEVGLPAILKPTQGSGSSGVRLCQDAQELTKHAAVLLEAEHKRQSSPRILVEEYAHGPYYSAIIMGNEVIGISTAVFGQPPHFVYHQYNLPADLNEDERKRIADIALNCLRALGLGWGPANIEFRWTKRGPVVIEVNPRLSGTPDPQMTGAAYGIDLITEHIKLVIGRAWDLRARRSDVAAARFLVPNSEGILEWIDGGSRAAEIKGVAEVKFYDKPNVHIVRRGDYRDCIGHVIAASHDRIMTEAILQRAVDEIDWSIRPVETTTKIAKRLE
ncbi:biotin carboxylase-like ATP-grasp domain-containing protein (plasmid) [Rhizobium etli]|uniref:Biotin carboxylase-like ATP-grasp domain-containing protein n=1 Tax=Rhizobium etli TaxID=29449 RepID=A0AAN1BL78_RHIET|nr:acetyl-CoA carboxylase biotin carboxylase subunit family protein [Rhizobium etli]ARQ13310.1 biotin carboxylase-like ATP-grasp domain-containing protein [Rhizobium etli]